MKIYKKIGLGLGIVIAALCFTLLKSPGRALAFDAQSQSDIQTLLGTLAFQDRTTITGTINGTKVSFVDNDITDGTFNYKPPDGSFCKTGGSVNGITLSGNAFTGGVTTVSATVDLDYSPDGTAGSCTDTKPNKLSATIGQFANRLTTFSWNGNDLTKLTSGDTFSHTADAVLFEKDTADNCGGGDIVILNDGSTTSGTEYLLTKSAFGSGGTPLKKFSNSHFTNSTCYLLSSQAITVSGTQGSTSDGGGAGGTQDGTQPDTCELSSKGFSLAWLMCPLLLAGEEISNNLINAFENELSFNVNQDLGNKNSQASVEKTWSLFKNIATAVLVILMLLMVFSQAISAGPFDAYTVRKMLPRIVIVAIAIQLSWPLVSFVIDTFDDIGRGIADIMYFSFGGADKLSLGHILNNAGIGTAEAATISWVGLVGAIGLGIAALPALLLLLLATGAAILTAVITLVLRKIIIILLLMLAPVALLAYVLPGTQRYWKLWLDNLIKILAMFPLVVALVAGGRIFALIVGSQDNTQFLNFLFICIGFFGPLFFLPKTFKWGGQLMSVAANGVASATNRFVGKESALGKGVQGYGERKQGEKAKAYNPLDPMWKRGLRRVQSGHAIPFSERSRRLTIATGNKWAAERNEEADAYVARTQEKALSGYKYYDMDEDGNFLQYSKNANGEYLDAAGGVVVDRRVAATNAAGQYIDADGNVVASEADAAQITQTAKSQAAFRALGKDDASKKLATFEVLTGVPAGKQALIDIAGSDDDSVTGQRAAQAAQKLLIDTHSEIEFQKSQIQGGKNQGRRANEVASWKSNITSSPQHYGTVNGSRPDFAPDLIESAEAAASRRLGRKVEYDTANAADRRQIDVEKSRIAIERLTPEQAASVHYGFYDDIGRIGSEPAVDSRTGAPILDAGGNPMNISQLLQAKLQDFHDAPGTVGRNAIGSLHGGKQEHVDAALNAAGIRLKDIG